MSPGDWQPLGIGPAPLGLDPLPSYLCSQPTHGSVTIDLTVVTLLLQLRDSMRLIREDHFYIITTDELGSGAMKEPQRALYTADLGNLRGRVQTMYRSRVIHNDMAEASGWRRPWPPGTHLHQLSRFRRALFKVLDGGEKSAGRRGGQDDNQHATIPASILLRRRYGCVWRSPPSYIKPREGGHFQNQLHIKPFLWAIPQIQTSVQLAESPVPHHHHRAPLVRRARGNEPPQTCESYFTIAGPDNFARCQNRDGHVFSCDARDCPGFNARDGFALHGCYALDSASNLVGGATTVYPFFYKLESQYLEVRDGAGTGFMCYADQNVGNRLGQSAPKSLDLPRTL
ncbi:uncharacterized protein PGTG_18601 [Puccinia graminis f. sp. tritici CRL 75-36-700-3]|uniref:Uncharacterized protein n=1 Tax=Puccinia graminis f. sp. tritici (strain CRL 75-36-700-3 / race SCCL) TaxID=418459 RepID=E3L7S7_PUCGT|nr:uncharacterized protein PGTG_18601 [Puccinia graminis f. sp. tritici CRL 75-36-700-3]EFP92602.2 hypothetical protein PGTG_18601 [Puccinia graminis f. sp. tritici CRL 75-36-700-3]